MIREGSAIWPGPFLFVIGGLILSRMLTLFTIPVVYPYLDRLQM